MSGTMSNAELRDHRRECVRKRLSELHHRTVKVHLHPKDVDPYPDFMISNVSEDRVTFKKLSSDQPLTINLGSLVDITPESTGTVIDIELRGRVVWDRAQQGWVHMSKAAAQSRSRF